MQGQHASVGKKAPAKHKFSQTSLTFLFHLFHLLFLLVCLLCVWCHYNVKSSYWFFCLFVWQKVTEEKYEIKVAYEEAAIKIVTTTDPKVVVTITLTSPVMREGEEAENGRCVCVHSCNHRALNKSFLRWNIANLCYLIAKIVLTTTQAY